MDDPGYDINDRADAYLHGLLSPEEMKDFCDRAEECPLHQQALESATGRLGAFHAVLPVRASEALIHKTTLNLAGDPRRNLAPLGKVFWSGCAAAALMIAAIHFYFSALRPSPYDLLVFGQKDLIADTKASLRVRVIHRNTREPVAGVPIEIELIQDGAQGALHLARFTTDAAGTANPTLVLPDWPDGDCQLRITARTGSRPDVVNQRVSLRRSWNVMLSTDKPVYQPGQTIHLRCLALQRPDLRPTAGSPVVFSIVDPQGNMIFKRRGVTSRFGIASADCPLAEEIAEGAYLVKCSVGDAQSEATVEIKKYTLPKFKIEVALDRPYYQPGELVRGDVKVSYFFGMPVAQAAIAVDVRSADTHQQAVAHADVQADDAGQGRFEFRVPQFLVGRGHDAADARLQLGVTVRDTAGQQETRWIDALVTASPLRIEVIPELGSLVPGVPNRVYVFTSYADGRPAPTRVAVSNVQQELVANQYGVTSFEIADPPPGTTIRHSFRAIDGQGMVATRDVTFRCGLAAADFIIRTDKAVYVAGQTLHLLALGGGLEPVFIDFVKDGQTILTRTLEMSQGQGRFEFDLPPELSGTLEICAYRFGRLNVPVRKTRIIHVQRASDLSIEAEFDQPEYRPGERARLTLTVTDATGKPAPGAVSLSAVDEAVYSVLAERPGLEAAFFGLEEKLFRPVYALYDWLPDRSQQEPSDQRNELDQALLSLAGQPRGNHDALWEELAEKYLEGDHRLLDVLLRPDWEELAEASWLPAEVIALLRGERSVHSLAASSFPAKEQAVAAARRAGIRAMISAWTVLGIVVTLGFLVVILRNNRLIEALVALFVGFLLISLALPGVQSARGTARRNMAMNDLKQIGIGLEMMAADKGTRLQTLLGDAARTETAPRLRQWFPETLLWRPEVVTDEQGRATLEFDLADSITSWRLAATAVTSSGRLGSSESSIRVFQPFFVDPNLPIELTRGDEVTVPIAVYNYLDEPMTVELTLGDASWFELLDESEKTIELGAGEVGSVGYRVRVTSVGRHEWKVAARGNGIADAVQRTIEVVPDGQLVQHVASGMLNQAAEVTVEVPHDAVAGSVRTIAKIYPSSFSQVVEGLDAVFRRPYGCFEQTSSTTYPNILALDYLRRTKMSAPEIEVKARQYIHLGCQRLVGFEVSSGGFDWFGNPPANRTLTAYGLMQFQDMARVHEVDPALIERTRAWLLAEQANDGSWAPHGGLQYHDPIGAGRDARLATTAYIAWAVFSGQGDEAKRAAARDYLLAHPPESIGSPYLLALVCNALLAMDAPSEQARPYLRRLVSLSQSAGGGRLVWWEMGPGRSTIFYGAGRSGNIETTALAALALIKAGQFPSTMRGALAWLIEQKDGQGMWHSTQATVLALKALVAAAGTRPGENESRQIEVAINGKTIHRLEIPADQLEVVQQVDLTDLVGPGRHRVTLTDRTGSRSGYQVLFRCHVPGAPQPSLEGPLAIDVAYDRAELHVNGVISTVATVVNHLPDSAPMVVLDLPIPPGFALETEELDDAVSAGQIAKYQTTPRSLIVYLRELAPASPLSLAYRLRATLPVKASIRPGEAYCYYDPDKRAASLPASVSVSE